MQEIDVQRTHFAWCHTCRLPIVLIGFNGGLRTISFESDNLLIVPRVEPEILFETFYFHFRCCGGGGGEWEKLVWTTIMLDAYVRNVFRYLSSSSVTAGK